MSLLLVRSLKDLQNHVNEPGAKVVLMASTTFCMPCRKMTPVFEEIATMCDDQFTGLKVNLDEAPDINGWLGVGSVPTFIFWRDGKEIYRVIGSCTKDVFISYINKFFG